VTLKFLLVLHWVVNITQLAAYAKQVCTQTDLTEWTRRLQVHLKHTKLMSRITKYISLM